MPTKRTPAERETAVLVVTDTHYGKKTRSFSTDGFAAKLASIAQRVGRIRELLKGYDFDALRIFLLGDVLDGSGIYPTQGHHQSENDPDEQAEGFSEAVAPWLAELGRVWSAPVEVDCVTGNHGRVGKFAHEGASWDGVAYRYLKDKLGAGAPLHYSKRHQFLRKVTIRRHNFLLYHGHEIKSHMQVPWYGMMTRIARWNTTKVLVPFDVVCMGHFHTFGSWVLNSIQVMLSGTMVTDDDWSLQTLGWESANKWWLFGVGDARPVTWQFGIDC